LLIAGLGDFEILQQAAPKAIPKSRNLKIIGVRQKNVLFFIFNPGLRFREYNKQGACYYLT
jgi:hypothetical protein